MSQQQGAGEEIHEKTGAISIDNNADQKGTLVEDIVSEAEEKALLRRIDLHLLPLLFFSYLLQYLDKTTLGYASILGVVPELKLTGDRYNWVSSAFYFGYMVASYPASFGFIKFPIAKYLSVTVIIWGVVLACHGATHSFASLTTVRVVLGVLESTITPGFTLITALWYKPREHPLRTCLWFTGNATGAIFGGLIAYAISHIKNHLKPWRWLFIIFGIVTSVWGFVLFFFLPDSPMTARWLNDSQRAYANRRPQANQKTFKSKTWKRDQFIEAVIDPKTWLLFFYTSLICIPNGGITNFNSIIIKGFGFSVFDTLLLGMPGPAVTLVSILTVAFLSNRFRRQRFNLMFSCLVLGIMGALLVRLLPAKNKWGRLVGIWFFSICGTSFPLALSVVASNFNGYTKKTTVNAIMFIGYCAGNIGGPFLFFPREAPHYNSGFAAIIVCLCVATILIMVLRFYLDAQNKRRDREQGIKIEAEPKEKVPVLVNEELLEGAEVDVTDWQNPRFRYYL